MPPLNTLEEEVRRMLDPQLLDLYTDYLIASHSLVTATGLAEMLDNA